MITEILDLLAAHPARERILGQLMLAQYRSGRPGDSLRTYEEWRRSLADDLGADPGADLQALHVAILKRDPALDRGPTRPPVADGETQSVRPHMLPAATGEFTGRSDETAAIIDVLTGRSGSIRRVAVSGSGGIGKTTLCVEVARTLADDFPDGQLYLDLHGTDPVPTDPSEALSRLLRALGVDGDGIPTDDDERADLYRNRLSERRLLVVLDNAADDDQVIPLVPADSRCGLLVNSRSRIGATFGATAIDLDVFDPNDAQELLQRIAGPGVVAPAADWHRLAAYCGHLPLALRIGGAKLATKPNWGVSRLLDLLADERERLTRLAYGKLDVSTCISLSYAGLMRTARRLLRGLGHAGLQQSGVWMAAAVLDCTAGEAEEALEDLFDARLAESAGVDATGRMQYRLHDLVRLFAQDRARAEDSPTELLAAEGRLAGALLSLLDIAHGALFGVASQNIVGTTPRHRIDEALAATIRAEPLRWVESEAKLIVDMVGRTSRNGLTEACWELACTSSPLLQAIRLLDENRLALTTALAAVETHRSRGAAAVTYRLGDVHLDAEDLEAAQSCYERAHYLLEDADDVYGQATVLNRLATIQRLRGDTHNALVLHERALPVLHEHGDEGGIAYAHRSLGQIHLTGRHAADAGTHFGIAMSIYERIGARQGVNHTRFWLGMLGLYERRYGEADAHFHDALSACRALGDRNGEAQCLRGLSLSFQRQGDGVRAAEIMLYEALQLVRQPLPTTLSQHISETVTGLRKTSA